VFLTYIFCAAWAVWVFGVAAFVTSILKDLRLEPDVRLRVGSGIFAVVLGVACIILTTVVALEAVWRQ